MPTYRQLSFLPTLAPAGRPDPDAEALRCRAGVEFHEINVREILNRSANRHLPFVWTINPYRGCEFACSYCYARYTHGFFDLHSWEDFEEKIFVKRGAAGSLRRRLRRAALENEPIAFGTATDPYQPAEHHYRVTRSLLEEMLGVDAHACRGLEQAIRAAGRPGARGGAPRHAKRSRKLIEFPVFGAWNPALLKHLINPVEI